MTEVIVAQRGRPRFEPTDEQRRNVEILVGLGIPEGEICRMVRDHKDRPISEPTLRKYFRKEIDQGAIKLNARVGNFLVATILGTPLPEGANITRITDERARANLMALYARTRMGWTETTIQQHQGKDRGPIILQIVKGDENL
jgi:hypothetical protein